MATEYQTATGYETAIADARKTGEGGPIDSFIDRMAERLGGKASVRAVFGDPIERDGLTIIPVARVRWGFGGGAGSGPVAVGPGRPGDAAADAAGDDPLARATASGSGGGGGVTADPVGYLEIGPDGASFIPISPAMPSPGFLLAAAAGAALVLRGLARLIRR
jgi:uncharacterized spore protein YtfJ